GVAVRRQGRPRLPGNALEWLKGDGAMSAMDPAGGEQESWPALPLAAWKETRDTLHMYTQVVGKVRLKLSPPEPEFGQVPLYLTARGLTTSPMAYQDRTVAIDFDFFDHRLRIQDSDGETRE